MGKDTEEIRADELAIGDKIRLRFMGGEEDVEISDVHGYSLEENGAEELISWHGWSSVTGSISDVVKADSVLRRVDG